MPWEDAFVDLYRQNRTSMRYSGCGGGIQAVNWGEMQNGRLRGR